MRLRPDKRHRRPGWQWRKAVRDTCVSSVACHETAYRTIFDTMTANIVIEMGYATDLHREALIATGVVLFVFILIINLCVSALKRRAEDE